MNKRRRGIPQDALKAEKALRIAVANVIEEHRQSGDPIVVWKNGKVVRIPAKRAHRSK